MLIKEMAMKKTAFILIGLCICGLLTGCKLFEDIGPTVPLEELQSAPEKITLGNREFILETDLARNFQPISPPGGGPLMASIYVTATDSLKFPSNINADRIWVVNGSKVWESNFEGSDPPHSIYQLAKGAHNGPKWGPDIYVDVVVRLIGSDGQKHLLKASHQWISEVW
jgi:hypothetical protein